ncbi:MAG TPA: helix-hairpin-helix domain-containing protein [Stenomitos sp.]
MASKHEVPAEPTPLTALDHMPGAEVVCPDGAVGQLEMLGVKPHSDEVTHLIVRRGFLFQRDLLVPAEWVAGVEEESNVIQLKAPLSDIVNLPEFEQPRSLFTLVWGLATWPIRLPFELALARWREGRLDVQDKIIQAARRARAKDLLEHHVFDDAVESIPLTLNLNTATAEELSQVRGIGHALAEQIIAHRPFQSLDDLHRIPSLSPQTLDRLREVAIV